MNSELDFPGVSRDEALRRLAEVDAGGVAVVTPNRRLAAALAQEFDARQSARGLVSWETADVLPSSAFAERLYEDALYSELAARLPLLLTPEQEQALWEAVIGDSPAGGTLLAAPRAAGLARDAWQLAHAWRLLARLRSFPANDDVKAFAEWAWRYEGFTERDRLVDRARLPDVVAPHLGHAALRKPATLIVFGFDIMTPQLRDFVAALAGAGVNVLASLPEARAGAARRIAFDSAGDELAAAARWARRRLESGLEAGGGASARAPRIGIVLPDLQRSREAVRRVFTREMEPGRLLAAGPARSEATRDERALPFNISLGEPLSSHPLAAAALLAFDLAWTAAGERAEFERASRLIRSPFIAGAETELDARARLDAELRKIMGWKIGLEGLQRAIERSTADDKPYRVAPCPILARRLAELAAFAKANLPGAKRPGEWSRVMLSLLDVIGFPGERELDPAEYQTLAKLQETIAGFAALDRVAARMRFGEALERVARIAADTLFQPETPEVPVQVLGVLESAGLEFDHLWVAGLTDEAWPLHASANPFLPVALQRAVGVPESSPAAALELDARLTRGWLRAAGEVVVSYPLREDDRDLAPSPLIRDLPEIRPEDLQLAGYPGVDEAIRRARRIERTADFRAPPLPRQGDAPLPAAGGTGVFRDQAACPFRAFARHRLRAEALEAPCSGLDASERGRLLHAVLAKLWSDLKSKALLEAASERDLEAAIGAAADYAIGRQRFFRADSVEGRFAQIERARLVSLARAWVGKEKQRPPFEVVAIEQKRALSFGGVTVNAKLDRMDRLLGEPGSHAILDYKTGAANVGDWLGPRPDEPQLPLYALGGEERVTAIAFACVKAGAMEFRGVARDAGLIPGVRPITEQRVKSAAQYRSWEELLSGWRTELETLGREFASGEASVRPKYGEETCRWCELKALCRINERESP